jgi:hypothetical protein
MSLEKPISLQVDEAATLVRLAGARGLVLMVGHLLLYHPAVSRLKKLVDCGELGELYYLHTERRNLGKVRKDENAMWSLGPHDISVGLYLLGELPESVASQGQPTCSAALRILPSLPSDLPMDSWRTAMSVGLIPTRCDASPSSAVAGWRCLTMLSQLRNCGSMTKG